MKKLAFAFFLAVVSWNLFAQDSCESNNSFGSPCSIDFGSTISALINQAGDNDYYLLNPTEAGVIEVQVQSVPSNIDLDLYLYGPGQGVEEVARYLNGPQGSGFTYWLSICEPGPHYLLLNDNDNDFNASVQYDFVVNFTPFSAVDRCECNNSFNDACPITFGQQESALVAPWFDNNPLTRDDDYYLLNTTEAGLIEVQVLNVPQDIDLDLYIYGPGQGAEEVARYLNAPQGSGFTYRLSICEPGPHYLLLNDNDNDFNASVQYNFVVNFTPFSTTDRCECNNSFNDACPITFGQQESALVAPWFDNNPLTRDDDYYLLNTTEAGSIEVQVLNVPQDIDLDLYIYGPGQGAEEVARYLNAPQGSGFTYRLSICEAGPHYLLLNDNDNDFNPSVQYNFVVNFTPFNTTDRCECNNSFNDACPITFGQQESALVAPWFDNNPLTRDDDYYEMNVEEPGVLKVEVLNVPQDIDLDLYLYGPGQGPNEVGRYLNAPEGSGFVYWLSTCEVGPHYLLFNDNDNDFNPSAQYNFVVDFTAFSVVDRCECNNSFNDACQLNTCDTIQALIGPWYDNSSIEEDEDFYIVELSETDNLNLLFNPVPENIRLCVNIYNSTQGQPVASYSGSDGQALDISFAPPTSGTYYLRVADCGNDFNGNDQYTMYVDVNCDLINALNGPATNNAIQVFPNPFESYLFIELPETAGQEAEIRISDLAGKALLFRKVANTGQIKIDTKHLPAGLFILTVQAAGKQYSSKLVKM
ncbi:MAG: T9SS type A sorting domain-containing protein [Phaeodactylibacter sp.]|nr:T9SS type A sorting domain-containing protein [Phaeodactylibacter sp.]